MTRRRSASIAGAAAASTSTRPAGRSSRRAARRPPRTTRGSRRPRSRIARIGCRGARRRASSSEPVDARERRRIGVLRVDRTAGKHVRAGDEHRPKVAPQHEDFEPGPSPHEHHRRCFAGLHRPILGARVRRPLALRAPRAYAGARDGPAPRAPGCRSCRGVARRPAARPARPVRPRGDRRRARERVEAGETGDDRRRRRRRPRPSPPARRRAAPPRRERHRRAAAHEPRAGADRRRRARAGDDRWPPATPTSSTASTTGERGSRHEHAGALLAQACGAEAGLVVNNNAAAVLLALGALARGREVVVVARRARRDRRRLPGPRDHGRVGLPPRRGGHHQPHPRRRLRARDRRPETALLLKVHTSNYRMVGFTEATPVAELATLGPPVMVDAGSGPARRARRRGSRTGRRGCATSPGVRQALDAGAALVTFSGDKLLGGPQAGIIVGRGRRSSRRIARHPLARALRADKLTLAALQQVALTLSRPATRPRSRCGAWRPRRSTSSAPGPSAIATAVPRRKVVDTEAVGGRRLAAGSHDPLGRRRGRGRRRRWRAGAGCATDGVVARADGRVVVCDLRTVDPADDAATARQRCPRARSDERRSPPRATSTTASRRWSSRSPAPIPTASPEEKARGLTIDLGFAFTTLPSGTRGRLRRRARVTSGSSRTCSPAWARSTWRCSSSPPTRAGCPRARSTSASSSCSASSTASSRSRRPTSSTTRRSSSPQLEIDERLAESPLDGAPIVACDALSGRGIDEVRDRPRRRCSRPRPPRRRRPARGCGSTGCSRPRAPARSSPARSTGGSARGRRRGRGRAAAHRVRVRGIETATKRLERRARHARRAEPRRRRARRALPAATRWCGPTSGPTAVGGRRRAARCSRASELRRRGRLQAYVGSGEHRVWLRVARRRRRVRTAALRRPLPLRRAIGSCSATRAAATPSRVVEVLDVDPASRARTLPTGSRDRSACACCASHRWLEVAALPRLAGLSERDAGDLSDGLASSGAAVLVGEWLVGTETLTRVHAACRRTSPRRTIDAQPHEARHRHGRARRSAARHAGAAPRRAGPGTRSRCRPGTRPARVAHAETRRPGRRSHVAATRSRPSRSPRRRHRSSVPTRSSCARSYARVQLVDVDGVVFAATALEQARAAVVGRRSRSATA